MEHIIYIVEWPAPPNSHSLKIETLASGGKQRVSKRSHVQEQTLGRFSEPLPIV